MEKHAPFSVTWKPAITTPYHPETCFVITHSHQDPNKFDVYVPLKQAVTNIPSFGLVDDKDPRVISTSAPESRAANTKHITWAGFLECCTFKQDRTLREWILFVRDQSDKWHHPMHADFYKAFDGILFFPLEVPVIKAGKDATLHSFQTGIQKLAQQFIQLHERDLRTAYVNEHGKRWRQQYEEEIQPEISENAKSKVTERLKLQTKNN